MTGLFEAAAEIVNDYPGCLLIGRLLPAVWASARFDAPHPASGRQYYFRPTNKKTGAALWLTEVIIWQHLQGEITIGLYTINPYTQRCKWVAIDAYKNEMEDLLKLEYYLCQDKVEPALEMSKRGGHLWILLERPLPAKGLANLHSRSCQVAGGTASKYFPGIMRLVKASLVIQFAALWEFIEGQAAVSGSMGADYTLAAQMAYLNRLRKLTEEELQAIIRGKEMPLWASER